MRLIRTVIAEDDAVVREVLSIMCRDLGLEVFEADDGQVCLELIEAHRPELLLLDLDMPRIDGMGVLAKLQGPGPRSPEVVIVTAHPDAFGRVDEQRLGVLDFVTKPFRVPVLRRRLERVIRLIELEHCVSDQEQSLVTLRQSDPVTGLGVFSGLRDSLTRRYAQCAQQGIPLSCGILSDELYDGLLRHAGRDPGNERLTCIAEHLVASLDGQGQCAEELYRVDAAEFVVLLPGADGAAARRSLEAMVGAMQFVFGEGMAAMASGFATVPHPELSSAESLFRAANLALARSREQSRLVQFEAF